MPTGSSTTAVSSSPPPSTRKRLLFDRRYGWVLDDWRDPSEEALSGGRGMFCIVPLAKSLLHKASESVNFVASSTLNVLERPNLIQDTLSEQMHNVTSLVKNPSLVFSFDDGNQKKPQ